MSEQGQGRVSRPVRRRRAGVIAAALVALAVGAVAAGTFSGWANPGANAGADANTPRPTAAPPTPTPTPTQTVPATPSDAPGAQAVPTFNRRANSVDDPASIWVIVDKARPFTPLDYTPPDLVVVPIPYVWEPRLRKVAAEAVVAMFAAFTAETGLRMQSQSAYRSYSTQLDVYNQDVAANGQAVADTSTARAGTGDHQTGLAIDISALPGNCSLNVCFADTAQGKWLEGNASRFGFVMRYPAGKTAITGYGFEPWHYRYVGLELATEMRTTGVSALEEILGLPAAPGYP